MRARHAEAQAAVADESQIRVQSPGQCAGALSCQEIVRRARAT